MSKDADFDWGEFNTVYGAYLDRLIMSVFNMPDNDPTNKEAELEELERMWRLP